MFMRLCEYSVDSLSSILYMFLFFFFQAEDGIRDLVRSRGLGDVYKRQAANVTGATNWLPAYSYRWQLDC